MFKLLKNIAGRRKDKARLSKKDTLASQKREKNKSVQSSVTDNLNLFKQIYKIPENMDVKIREFTLGKSGRNAAILFISSIIDSKRLEESIIKPLLECQDDDAKISEIIFNPILTPVTEIKKVIEHLNLGNAAIFLDGDHTAYMVDCAKFESRAIEQPQNEAVIKGPKEAFTEKVVVNLSLIRKRIKNEKLIVEATVVSERSKNEVLILYIRNLADEKMVANIQSRLENLSVDAVQNLSLLEQYIEERRYSLFPSVLYTERPDRAVSFLEDGNIILLMDNSPDCMVLPATFWSYFHSPEDHYLRFAFGNFSRIIRIVALFITLFTSAIYVAVTTYHAEMIPADLLLAIAGTRERVPFPAFFEILIMEMAFELIREAGLRVPNPMGPTIGIVGALILGQAAVEANIISPIVIIVVALSGLSSFAISDVSLNFAIRIVRFGFIFSASLFGIYGMTALFITGLFYMVSIKSFGVPYLAPMSPHYVSSGDTIFRKVLTSELFRPGYLKPADLKKKGDGSTK